MLFLQYRNWGEVLENIDYTQSYYFITNGVMWRILHIVVDVEDESLNVFLSNRSKLVVTSESLINGIILKGELDVDSPVMLVFSVNNGEKTVAIPISCSHVVDIRIALERHYTDVNFDIYYKDVLLSDKQSIRECIQNLNWLRENHGQIPISIKCREADTNATHSD